MGMGPPSLLAARRTRVTYFEETRAFSSGVLRQNKTRLARRRPRAGTRASGSRLPSTTSISGLKVAVMARRRGSSAACSSAPTDRSSVMNDIERGRNERTDGQQQQRCSCSSCRRRNRRNLGTPPRRRQSERASERAKPKKKKKKQDEERFNKVLNQKCHRQSDGPTDRQTDRQANDEGAAATGNKSVQSTTLQAAGPACWVKRAAIAAACEWK